MSRTLKMDRRAPSAAAYWVGWPTYLGGLLRDWGAALDLELGGDAIMAHVEEAKAKLGPAFELGAKLWFAEEPGVQVIVKFAFPDRGAPLVPGVPHDLQADTADGREQAAERLKLPLFVSGAVQLLVQGQEALVEDVKLHEEIPGGVEWPQPQFTVAGDVKRLGDGLAIAGASPPERDQE